MEDQNPTMFSQKELAALEIRASEQYNNVTNPVWKSAYLRLTEATRTIQSLQGKQDRAGCETQ